MNARTKRLVSLGRKFHAIYQHCMICGRTPIDMAHLVGKNVSYIKNGEQQNDPTKLDSVVPLCRKHHAEYDKKTSLDSRVKFWQIYGIYSIAEKIKYKFMQND